MQSSECSDSDKCSPEEKAVIVSSSVRERKTDSAIEGPPVSPTRPINIVIACHSHAPLQEFWNRVPGPKFCVSMPCCGKTWSSLSEIPICAYEDYEVFSPKRLIFLYHSEGDKGEWENKFKTFS